MLPVQRSLLAWIAVSASAHAAIIAFGPTAEQKAPAIAAFAAAPIRATVVRSGYSLPEPAEPGPSSAAVEPAAVGAGQLAAAAALLGANLAPPEPRAPATSDAAAPAALPAPTTPSLDRLAIAPVGLAGARRHATDSTGLPSANQQPAKSTTTAVSALPESEANPTASAERVQDYRALLAFLHAQISKHKRYPALARRQRREGTATVAFHLRPNGGLERLAVLHSSGHGALDDAALRAVRGGAPFQLAGAGLLAPRRFTVSVSFQLTEAP